jgi:hypothetical protein
MAHKLVTDELIEKAQAAANGFLPRSLWRAALEAIANDLIERCAREVEQPSQTSDFEPDWPTTLLLAESVRSLKSQGQ